MFNLLTMVLWQVYIDWISTLAYFKLCFLLAREKKVKLKVYLIIEFFFILFEKKIKLSTNIKKNTYSHNEL